MADEESIDDLLDDLGLNEDKNKDENPPEEAPTIESPGSTRVNPTIPNNEERIRRFTDKNSPPQGGVDTAATEDDSDGVRSASPSGYKHSAADPQLKVRKSAADRKGIPIERRKKARERWEKTIRGAMVATRFVHIINNRRQTYVHVDEEGTVFFKIKLLFALPQFSLIPLTLLINVYIIIFYNTNAGVSLSFISFFQIFARSFDVLTDPLMAHISDNLTHTKRGRRIPYMMLCPLYAIAFYILVSPPLDDADTAAYWFGGSYMFFYLCDTLVNVPFQALGPELTDDSDKRTEIYMFVKLAEGIGIIVGTLTPTVLLTWVSQANSFKMIAVFFGLWYITSMYALIFTVKERPASVVDQGKVVQPFVTSLFRSIRNPAFRPLMIGWVLDFASLALIATMLPFYLEYYVQPDDADSVLGYAIGAFFVSGFCAIPAFKYISRHDRKSDAWYEKLKIGQYNAWLTYNVINVSTNFCFIFIGEGDLYLLYFCMILNGIPTGGQFLISSVLCDVIDYDEFLNYKRNEGQFSVFSTFIPKLIAIPCQSFPLVGMFLLGYQDPDTDSDLFVPQNTRVKWFIRILFVFVPLILVSVSFLVKRTYPINKAQLMVEIGEGITKHMQGEVAMDPLTKKDCWIEEMNDVQQYLSYLLDQFNHDQLLWLLSPDQIYKRHIQQGLPLRKNTLRHITIDPQKESDDDDSNNNNNNDQKDEEAGNANALISATSNSRNSKGTGRTISFMGQKAIMGFWDGCCNCCKKDDELYPEMMEGAGDIKFGKNENGKIIYMSVSKFEAHGVDMGTRRIQRQMLIWVFFYIICAIAAIIGVITTWHLLNNEDYAFVPAVCCLCVGLSITAVGFFVLRFRAGSEIREWVEKHHLSEEIIAKCIYPKTKGQRGGESLNDQDLAMIEEMVPRATALPQHLKSLTDLTILNSPLLVKKPSDENSTLGPEEDLYK